MSAIYPYIYKTQWPLYWVYEGPNTYPGPPTREHKSLLNNAIRLDGVVFIIVFRLVRDIVANHKTTRYAGAATKVIQKNHLA